MTGAASILLYVRPWNVAQMEHLARGVWGADARLQLTSEHRSIDGSGLAEAFTAAFRESAENARPRFLSESEVSDMILRCRLLRSLAPGLARRLLLAMERAVDGVLTRTLPATMLSLSVDSFVMDLFRALCAKRGIRFIGLVASFLKGHFRVTARGEHVDSRPISSAQIDTMLGALTVREYRPDFLVKGDRAMREQMWRLWLRNLPKPVWFALRRMRPGEALNYHFWVSQRVATGFWSPWPRQPNGVNGQALAALCGDGGLPLIYLPLQKAPEVTVDYWSRDTRWIDYERFILDLMQRYRGKWRFLVKEHPNLLTYRSRGFYAQLEAEPNCVMVSPEVPSNDLVALCRGVLVCTGTVGFEAALRGKPVLSDSAPYYAWPGLLLPIAALDDDLPEPVTDDARPRRLMAHVLRGTLPGRFVNDGSWSAEDPRHRAWSDAMAASIRGYLRREGCRVAAAARSEAGLRRVAG